MSKKLKSLIKPALGVLDLITWPSYLSFEKPIVAIAVTHPSINEIVRN